MISKNNHKINLVSLSFISRRILLTTKIYLSSNLNFTRSFPPAL